jgi:hypothetical protein
MTSRVPVARVSLLPIARMTASSTGAYSTA